MIQWLFEHIHVFGGMPWWASIVATAAVCRLAIFPLLLKSSDNGSKMAMLAPQVGPISAKMREALANQDQVTAMKARAQMSKIYKDSGVSMKWMLAPLLTQIPLGFGLWRTSRGMADVPIPGMETGGLWWFSNLAHSDPLFILPFATAILQYFGAKVRRPLVTISNSQY